MGLVKFQAPYISLVGIGGALQLPGPPPPHPLNYPFNGPSFNLQMFYSSSSGSSKVSGTVYQLGWYWRSTAITWSPPTPHLLNYPFNGPSFNLQTFYSSSSRSSKVSGTVYQLGWYWRSTAITWSPPHPLNYPFNGPSFNLQTFYSSSSGSSKVSGTVYQLGWYWRSTAITWPPPPPPPHLLNYPFNGPSFNLQTFYSSSSGSSEGSGTVYQLGWYWRSAAITWSPPPPPLKLSI